MAEEAKAVTKSGLDENLAGALAYVFGWLTGVIFLVLEPENKFVKFHSIQSILLSVAIFIVAVPVSMFSWFLPSILGLIFSCLMFFVWLAVFIGWLFLMYKAYKGEMFKLPVIGDLAEKQAMK